jgi:hypothetical protein
MAAVGYDQATIDHVNTYLDAILKNRDRARMHPDCGTSSSFTKRADTLGDPEFLAGIPNEWIDQAVLDLILWPMKDPSAPYPAW